MAITFEPHKVCLDVVPYQIRMAVSLSLCLESNLFYGKILSGSTASGTIYLQQSLTGSVNTFAGVHADITVWRYLQGALSGSTTLTGTLANSQVLNGLVNTTTIATGTLANSQALQGAATAATTASGTLTKTLGIAGALSSTTAVSGTISKGLTLNGLVNTNTALTGTLGRTLKFDNGSFVKFDDGSLAGVT